MVVVSIVLRSLFLSSIVLAGPVEHSQRNTFEKRDPCNGVDAEPVLYHKYGTDKCPPKFRLKDDRCYPDPNTSWKCEQFCQLETTFLYGQEQPFANAYCHGPQTCTITSTETRTITWNVNFNPKFLEAYQFGITGGFSIANAKAIARAFQIKLENGQCGYFTFVPVIKKTCGKIGAPTHCTARPNVNEDVCVEQLRLNKDGSIDGETIFVRTDCSTRMPLGKDQQDPVYQKPGVPLDRGMQESWASTWKKNDLDGMNDEDITCNISEESPSVEDCLSILNTSTENPDQFVNTGANGKSYWPSYKEGCAIALNYKSNWIADTVEEIEAAVCSLTRGDVAIASFSIADKCTANGKIGGKRPFGRDKCEGEIEFIVPEGSPPNGF